MHLAHKFRISVLSHGVDFRSADDRFAPTPALRERGHVPAPHGQRAPRPSGLGHADGAFTMGHHAPQSHRHRHGGAGGPHGKRRSLDWPQCFVGSFVLCARRRDGRRPAVLPSGGRRRTRPGPPRVGARCVGIRHDGADIAVAWVCCSQGRAPTLRGGARCYPRCADLLRLCHSRASDVVALCGDTVVPSGIRSHRGDRGRDGALQPGEFVVGVDHGHHVQARRDGGRAGGRHRQCCFAFPCIFTSTAFREAIG